MKVQFPEAVPGGFRITGKFDVTNADATTRSAPVTVEYDDVVIQLENTQGLAMAASITLTDGMGGEVAATEMAQWEAGDTASHFFQYTGFASSTATVVREIKMNTGEGEDPALALKVTHWANAGVD